MKKYIAPNAELYALGAEHNLMLTGSLNPNEKADGNEAMTNERTASQSIWDAE